MLHIKSGRHSIRHVSTFMIIGVIAVICIVTLVVSESIIYLRTTSDRHILAHNQDNDTYFEKPIINDSNEDINKKTEENNKMQEADHKDIKQDEIVSTPDTQNNDSTETICCMIKVPERMDTGIVEYWVEMGIHQTKKDKTMFWADGNWHSINAEDYFVGAHDCNHDRAEC